jgi:hypothetical protein
VDGALTVARWRRYGNDRLYVSTVEGTRVGWHDLLSGETHVEATADRDAVMRAVATWRETALVGSSETVLTAAPDLNPYRRSPSRHPKMRW